MGAPDLVWRQIFWPRPLTPELATGLLRRWASDQRSPTLVLEAQATTAGISYSLGATPAVVDEATATLSALVPGTVTVTPGVITRSEPVVARRLSASTRHRALDADRAEPTSRAVLAALSRVRDGEQLVLQVILGPRRIPLAVPTNSPSSIVAPWWQIAWHGNGQQVDSEKRTALRGKVETHGFAATVRLAVSADTPRRRQLLLLSLMAALRSSETPGLQLRLRRDRPDRVHAGSRPWTWPLRLNAAELLCLLGWPLGDGELPGLPAAHPKRLPATAQPKAGARLVATATAPGAAATLALSARDALQHLHVLGPTGVGKSTLLAGLISQDIAAGRGVVVIEPKGDLVEEVLARIPEHRHGDVIVLDGGDSRPVGLNPLHTAGRNPEVVADGILSVFKALYAEAWGPRTQDILHASLLTLARRPDASLVMLPLLLTNPGFRHSVTASLRDPIALGPAGVLPGQGGVGRASAPEGRRLQPALPLLPERGRRLSPVKIRHLSQELSTRDLQVLDLVSDHHFLTGRHLSSLLFRDHSSVESGERCCRRVLARLVRLRVLEHLERRIGGVRAGSASYIYRVGLTGDRLLRDRQRPRDDQAGGPRLRRKEPSLRHLDHVLAVADARVALTVAPRGGAFELLSATPEPGCWRSFQSLSGTTEVLKPDLHAVTASGAFEDHWFLEIDRATESLPTIVRKCRPYAAYQQTGIEQKAHGVFPRVIWVCPDQTRADTISRTLASNHVAAAELFRVTTTNQLPALIAQGAA